MEVKKIEKKGLGEEWNFPGELQACEPGPRGRVGKGKSKYLRYLDSKQPPLHAWRPEASADLELHYIMGPAGKLIRKYIT